MPDVMVEQTALAGVKLCTKEADASMAVMEARLHLVNGGFLPETVETVIELLDADGKAAAVDRRRVSVYGNDEAELTARIYISYAGGIIGLNQEKPKNQGFALI